MGKSQEEVELQPFIFQGYYFQIHVAFVDFMYEKLSNSEIALMIFVIRHTTESINGYYRSEFKKMSYQFLKGSGIKSDTTLSKCLKRLVDELGYLERIAGGIDFSKMEYNKASYRLNRNVTIKIPKGFYDHPEPVTQDDSRLQKMESGTPKNGADSRLQKMESGTPKNGVFKGDILSHEFKNMGGKGFTGENTDISLNGANDISVSKLLEYAEQKTGPLADLAGQEAAARWLVATGYEFAACSACFDHYLAKMDMFQGWPTVKKYIGAWVGRKKNGGRKLKPAEKAQLNVGNAQPGAAVNEEVQRDLEELKKEEQAQANAQIILKAMSPEEHQALHQQCLAKFKSSSNYKASYPPDLIKSAVENLMIKSIIERGVNETNPV